MARYDKVYDQVSHPDAGTTGSGADKNDALGNPGRFKRNLSTVAECDPKQELVELREKQLDSSPTDPILGNMYQGN